MICRLLDMKPEIEMVRAVASRREALDACEVIFPASNTSK
jgi:hypothetical protein